MPRKARPNPKPKRQRTFIRQWRTYGPKFIGHRLTLAKLSERLEAEHGIILSEGQLSRIERGESPYNQDMMEAIADICGTDVASLLNRDPSKGAPAWGISDTFGLDPTEAAKVQAYIEGIKASRTGTDG